MNSRKTVIKSKESFKPGVVPKNDAITIVIFVDKSDMCVKLMDYPAHEKW